MNTLEFIENIIKNLKEILKGIDNRIQEDQNYPTLLAHHIGEKEQFEKELAHFHQIKSELEAWYVVKDKVEIKRTEVFDHVLRIKQGKGALTHEEFRPLKNLIRVGDK